METAVTAAAAAADVPTMTWRRVVFGFGAASDGAPRHLLGETTVEVGEEFLARGVSHIRALPGRAQLDRGADLRRLEVVGRKRLRPAAP